MNSELCCFWSLLQPAKIWNLSKNAHVWAAQKMQLYKDNITNFFTPLCHVWRPVLHFTKEQKLFYGQNWWFFLILSKQLKSQPMQWEKKDDLYNKTRFISSRWYGGFEYKYYNFTNISFRWISSGLSSIDYFIEFMADFGGQSQY